MDNNLRKLKEGSYLSDTELLSIIIGGRYGEDIARDLLRQYEDFSRLATLSLEELQQTQGIGPATAAQIKAAIEIGLRLRTYSRDRKTVSSPADAASLVMSEMRLLEQESVRSILLDTRNGVISIVEVYKGSLNTSMIRVGELFREAVRRNAANIIVIHNHPSGDPSPSPDDVAVTRMMVEAGRLLDIPVHDHIVIGNNRFVSLKERGLGFS